jgi:RNA recognition motif-containing protein
MVTKLFVGRLSFDTTNDGLQELFAQYGAVASVQIVNDRGTDRSKGFGFVEMQDLKAAQEAIKVLDGKEFEGHTIVVNAAKSREDRPQGNTYRSGFQRR